MNYTDNISEYPGKVRANDPCRESCIWLSETGDIFFVGYAAGWMVYNYHIRTTVAALESNIDAIKKTIEDYLASGNSYTLSYPGSNFDDYYFKKAGFIKKALSFDEMNASSIKAVYRECLSNNEFPDDKAKEKIKEEIDDYLTQMSKIR